MSALGFCKTEEYLPQFDHFKDNFSKRRLFLEFFNNQVCKELQFSKHEIEEYQKLNLCDVFIHKIVSLFDANSVPFYSKVSLDKKNIEHFFSSDIQKLLNMKHDKSAKIRNTEKNSDVALKLFAMVDGINLTLKVDAQLSFEQFIMKKLLKDQKTRYIQKECDCINIISSKEHDIKIFPYWKFFDDEKECVVDEHISKAVQCIKESEYKNVYLVYPKNDNFNKHLQVKIPEFEQNKEAEAYGIKIIPYSLRSILR
ncbi:MAG: hypothetical protein ACNI3C_00015 [Candidatus Marinarcus sp.]|uniref:hypothetical protein n=1 Tax=Candidatus Marinarcus sp. TaxID=3100987 RepID=UPI003AFF662D